MSTTVGVQYTSSTSATDHGDNNQYFSSTDGAQEASITKLNSHSQTVRTWWGCVPPRNDLDIRIAGRILNLRTSQRQHQHNYSGAQILGVGPLHPITTHTRVANQQKNKRRDTRIR